jgi:hypothetical protein
VTTSSSGPGQAGRFFLLSAYGPLGFSGMSRRDQPMDGARPKGVNVNTPNVARMYDYFLGGKDNN